jgi:hypothetical protein
MNPPKVILINGPPRSGKDYAGSIIENHWLNSRIFRFATHVKARSQKALLDFDGCEDITLFEDCKDLPSDFLFDRTPRDVWISFSEKFMKPLFGNDIFGQLLLRDLIPYLGKIDLIIIPDSGFEEEAKVLIDALGPQNIFHIRLSRNGCDFSRDSRGYLDLSEYGVKSTRLHNDGDEFFETEVIDTVKILLGEWRIQ